MPTATSSPIPAVLAKLGPLDPDRVADLRPYLDSVPDPRSRRGRWYSLTAILLVCACATISGAKSIDELVEWGARVGAETLAAIGIRRHLLQWRHSPSRSTIGRALERLDGDALDRAVGAYLADRLRAPTADTSAKPQRRIIAVDGKALKGSARLGQPRRHLLSALTHGIPVTIAQAEVGSKTNETRHFKPLLAPLDLAGDIVTFDALHTIQAHAKWLVETKKAHYIAVVKSNQPTALAQISAHFGEDASTVHAGSAPRAMASLRNLAISALKTLGATNIAKTTRAIAAEPERAPPILGITDQPGPSRT